MGILFILYFCNPLIKDASNIGKTFCGILDKHIVLSFVKNTAAKYADQAISFPFQRSDNFEMPFWCLQILPKNEQRIRLYYYDTSGQLFFVCLWKKLKTPKRHFEII